MRSKTLSIGLKTALASFTTAICTVAIFTSTLFVTEASAGTLKILHNFNVTDGSQPAGVVLDASGNLYGVAQGGSRGFGLAFELTPTASGHWNEKALIQFDHATGMYPNPVVFDSVGNLYGTLQKTARLGTGAVFELSPTTDGQWDEKILNVMDNSEGADLPWSVTFDASGNIFSMADGGGKHGGGTIFELSPTANGSWQETTLESFTLKDGAYPAGNPVFDAAGNLYGATELGGDFNAGTVFELSPGPGGTWTYTVLYSFTGKADGYDPSSSVTLDAAGNLYGTTTEAGASGNGTVFELSPNGDGTWTNTVLYSFQGGLDGGFPFRSALTFDKAGNLYGETFGGGSDRCPGGCGVVFELSPNGGGSWTESVAYWFDGTDGWSPWQGLVFDAAGNLYGTTQDGGAYGQGVVFELKP
jgi:uncharacterized repeat protein (TIGR03803 family)